MLLFEKQSSRKIYDLKSRKGSCDPAPHSVQGSNQTSRPVPPKPCRQRLPSLRAAHSSHSALTLCMSPTSPSPWHGSMQALCPNSGVAPTMGHVPCLFHRFSQASWRRFCLSISPSLPFSRLFHARPDPPQDLPISSSTHLHHTRVSLQQHSCDRHRPIPLSSSFRSRLGFSIMKHLSPLR